MGKFIDLTGETFGRLTVQAEIDKRKWGNVVWLCRCDCGEIIEVKGANLRSGATKSCGCLQKERVSQEHSGEKHYLWLGDKAGYTSTHDWLRKNKPKPKLCERCRTRPPQQLSYNHKNGEWSRNVKDYEWLCASCHRLKDQKHETKPMTKFRIHRIREFRKCGITLRLLAKMFLVSHKTILNIINCKGIYVNV